MSTANLSFFLTEASVNIKRSGAMTFITISTIAISLLLMGGFLLATINMETLLGQMQDQALVTVYMSEDSSSDEAKALKLKLTSFDEISQISLISPQQAARELFSDPDDKKNLQEGFLGDDNPLPFTLRVKVNANKDLKTLVTRIKTLDNVEDVSYGKDLFDKFKSFSRLLWFGSLIIILFLGSASLFIVYNTIRLTLFMRKEEIVIMKLVGATNWFVRGPFLVEGFIHGAIGSLFAVIILFAGYRLIIPQLSMLVPFFSPNIDLGQLIKLSVKLFMMGIILGVSGSLLSLRDISSFSKSSVNGA